MEDSSQSNSGSSQPEPQAALNLEKLENDLSGLCAEAESKLILFEMMNRLDKECFCIPRPGGGDPIGLDELRTSLTLLDVVPFGHVVRAAADYMQGEGGSLLADYLHMSGVAHNTKTLSPWTPRGEAEDLALVLSGGALLGSFQAGAMEYLVDGPGGPQANWPRFRPNALGGTSVGAVNGVAMSCFHEHSGERLSAIWQGITKQSDFVELDPEVAKLQNLVNRLPLIKRLNLSIMDMLSPFPARQDRKARRQKLGMKIALFFVGLLSVVSMRFNKLLTQLQAANDGLDIRGVLTHLPIQKLLFQNIDSEYTSESGIPFICPQTNLTDSHEYISSSDGMVYKYSYHDGFRQIQGTYVTEYVQLPRSFARELADETPGLEYVEMAALGHPADREFSHNDDLAYDDVYLRVSVPDKPVETPALKFRVLPGVSASANIPLALGTIDSILCPAEAEQPPVDTSGGYIQRKPKMFAVDGALRLNFPINALLNHFEDNWRQLAPAHRHPMNFRKLIAVSCTTRTKEYDDFTQDGEEGVQILQNLSRSIDIVLNQISVASCFALDLQQEQRDIESAFIDPQFIVHSGYVVDPGLIRINMDYGRMRAFEAMDLYPQLIDRGVQPERVSEALVMLGLISLEIAMQRTADWDLEQRIILTMTDHEPRFWRRALKKACGTNRSANAFKRWKRKIDRHWKAAQVFIDLRQRNFPNDKEKQRLYGPKSLSENLLRLENHRHRVRRLADMQREYLQHHPQTRAPAYGTCEMHIEEIAEIISLLERFGISLVPHS